MKRGIDLADRRYLRSTKLRAALYEAAEGRCQICGDELRADWQADHIVPYSITHRTNVYEMQALCPACNAKKGARVESRIDQSKLRQGQRLAVAKIVERVRAGESHTAIVLPTRYGKTDVMRVSGMMLIPNFISRALILVPNNYLRAQVVDGSKWEKSNALYNLSNRSQPIAIEEAVKPPTPPFPRHGSLFVSMTIQMAQNHNELLAEWVDKEKYRYGVPPLVFVDEAHTGSTENQWGRCVNGLAEAGAFIVLLTATPFRTDQEHIPGFELEPVDVDNVIKRRRSADDPERWDVFEGRRRIYQLKAHHTTTFKEAWATQNPPVLCDITRRAFDIETEEIDPLTGEIKQERVLSKLPADKSNKVLDVELRKPRIINQACQLLVMVLTVCQKEEPETAAIVFVGNDKPGDEQDNKHASDVKAAIERLSPNFNIEIATSSTNQANKTIERFVQQTDIDILIVKQMAGLGVDCDRLKVCLDLSNVRTLNAFIQRVTRIATVWDRREISGNAWDIGDKAVYITPDDIVGKRLYDHFVHDQGGGSTRDDLEYMRTVRIGENGDTQYVLPDEVIAKRVIPPEEVQDTKRQTVPGSTLPLTDRMFDVLPELTKTRTQPDLAKALAAAGFDVPGLNGDTPKAESSEPNGSPPVTGSVDQRSEKHERLRKNIDKMSKRIATQSLGRTYRKGDQQYIDKIKDVKTKCREDLGIPWSVKLEDVELDMLERMFKNMAADLRRQK